MPARLRYVCPLRPRWSGAWRTRRGPGELAKDLWTFDGGGRLPKYCSGSELCSFWASKDGKALGAADEPPMWHLVRAGQGSSRRCRLDPRPSSILALPKGKACATTHRCCEHRKLLVLLPLRRCELGRAGWAPAPAALRRELLLLAPNRFAFYRHARMEVERGF